MEYVGEDLRFFVVIYDIHSMWMISWIVILLSIVLNVYVLETVRRIEQNVNIIQEYTLRKSA